MTFEIIETPIRFHLYGLAAEVQSNSVGEVGLKLMNELWKVVKESETATTGINHWVYLPGNQMFVGVELTENTKSITTLEPLAFELPRYLRHVHAGPYQLLPAKWASLKASIAGLGETTCSPCMEIYGHHNADPTKLETTILIGLGPK